MVNALNEDPLILSKIQQLALQTNLTNLSARICFHRGYDTPEKIQHFLHPDLVDLTDPFLLEGMELAVVKTIDYFKHQKPIIIFGDYDVDGTCGAALLGWFFRELKIPIFILQPDRFKDGYGLKSFAVDYCEEKESKLLISVDCGTTSFDVAALCKKKGIQLIVLDHHQPKSDTFLDSPTILINPQQKTCLSKLNELCGCGVAFYFIRALRNRLKKLFPNEKPINLKQHLDLVTLATACDMVPLVKDNHILVRFGLIVLKDSNKPGIRSLLNICNLDQNRFSPSSLGFQLGPMINAAGRIKSANIALSLLLSQSETETLPLCKMLQEMNEERSTIQNNVWDDARSIIGKEKNQLLFSSGICVGSSHWHEGVIGIVASRVTEHFKKPACVASFKNEIAKASFRSYGNKNILEALEKCSHLLTHFGGHHHAAGCSLLVSDFEAFTIAFNDALKSQGVIQLTNLWDKALKSSIDHLSFKTLLEIESMGPFGIGNPEPLIYFQARMKKPQILKERHLKMQLQQDHKTFMEAIWFQAMEQEHSPLDIIDIDQLWLGVPELNRFRGKITPTLRVKEKPRHL